MLLTGTADPTRVSIPLHLAANGSLEVDDQPVVLLAGDGTEYLLDDSIERAEGVGVPPMRDLLAKLRAHEVPVYVWRGCADARGVTDEDVTKVGGVYTTPPEAARLLGEVDQVVTG
jgi:predicted peroxiredoxin